MAMTFARRQAYLSNARAAGLRWRGYLSLAAVIAAALAVGVIGPAIPLKQFYVGVTFGAVVMIMSLAATRFDDPQTNGYYAELATVDSLKKVRDWCVIDNVAFEQVDVDHVVVTPAAVLAVETKWHGRSSSAGHERDRARRDRDAARRGERKISSLMLASGLRDVMPVVPVLVVWGPGSPDLGNGYRLVDGVYVVDGNHPELWSHLFRTACTFRSVRHQIADAIATFALERAEFEATKNGSLRTAMWREFRDGVRAERSRRADRDRLVATLPPAAAGPVELDLPEAA